MLTIITNIFVYIAFPIIVGITIVIFQKTFESYEIDMKKVITKIKNPLGRCLSFSIKWLIPMILLGTVMVFYPFDKTYVIIVGSIIFYLSSQLTLTAFKYGLSADMRVLELTHENDKHILKTLSDSLSDKTKD